MNSSQATQSLASLLDEIRNIQTSNARGLNDMTEHPDTTSGYLLQVIIPVLMVFIIATFLYARSAEKEVEAAKARAAGAEARQHAMEQTKDGAAFVKMETALINLQQQRLDLGLEQIEQAERKKLMLTTFVEVNNKPSDAAISALIVNGKLSAEYVGTQFKEGSTYAFNCFADDSRKSAYIATWRSAALKAAGLLEPDPRQTIAWNETVLTDKNSEWLDGQIIARQAELVVECKRVQSKAQGLILAYLWKHPEEVQNDVLNVLLAQYHALLVHLDTPGEGTNPTTQPSNETMKTMVLKSLVPELRAYSSAVLENGGAPTLP